MSFTAEVKDELSRIEDASPAARRAELAALIRTEGTLGIEGKGRYRLDIATENAAVARRIIVLLHGFCDLATNLTVRHSVLHKARNYLISIPPQPQSGEVLTDLGVITASGGLCTGLASHLVTSKASAAAYLRGAFLGAGFIADPHGDFHFEITMEDGQLADDLVALMAKHGVPAKSVLRRTHRIVYLKGADQIIAFLAFTGAARSVLEMEEARVVKSVRNEVNRRVNAEMANQRKTSAAALEQTRAIRALIDRYGLDSIPPALQELAELRLAHPEATLKELGEYVTPPLSKSAVYHRVRRIEELARSLLED